VIPKVNSRSDLQWAVDFINHKRNHIGPEESTPRRIKVLALIESAKAIANLREICETATSQLDGLIFAAEDFALDLSLTRTPSLTEFLYARSAIATACRAHELPSTIDLVCTSFKGEEGRKTMEEECLRGKGLGFNGKQCIHPNQVPIAQKAFAPSDEDVAWAVRVVIADEKADKQGRGAWTLDGKMIDVPVVRKAKSLVGKAVACGIDVDTVREHWIGQEPE
jgi:citrate lyase subunit beta-like protein